MSKNVETLRLDDTTELLIEWEPLDPDFMLPDYPVESISHALLAASLTDALEGAGVIKPPMLIASHLPLCVKLDGRTIAKVADWVYIPFVKELLPNRRSYVPVIDGDRPALIIEFLSEVDLGEHSIRPVYPYGRWFLYEKVLKVPVYAIFDGVSGILEVHFLESGVYQLQSPNEKHLYWIDSLGLYLGVTRGEHHHRIGFWLRWWNESEEALLWENERSALAEQQATVLASTN